MPTKTITPIYAIDVDTSGKVTPITDPWPNANAKKGHAYRWLHFDMTDTSLAEWMDDCLPTGVGETLLQTETRPRCDPLEGGMVLNLRGVNLNPGANPDDMVSARFWVADGIIISARVRKVWAIEALHTKILSGTVIPTIDTFLAELTYGITKRIEKVSLALVENTDDLEETSLGQGAVTSIELAALRQSVIKLRRFVRPQAEALTELGEGTNWAFSPDSAGLMRETVNKSLRTLEELDATSDRLQAIQDHLDMLHNAALGRNSYVLSVIAAIFLPLGFLTGLFGINVGGMPWVDANFGFWLVTVGSVLIGALLFAVFRFLKWL